MNKLLLAGMAVLVGLPLGAQVQDEILVIVNDHIVTRRTLRQAVEQETASLYRTLSGKALDEKLKEVRQSTLNGLVDAFLVQDKASELNLRIPDEYVRNYVEEVKKQNQFATDADMEKALKASMGIDLPTYIKRLKQQNLQQMVLQREVFSKIAVEDQELLAYFQDHQDEYRLPSRFRIRELVLSKGPDTKALIQSKAKIESLKKQVAEGRDFEELVRLNSTSPSRDAGGDLGWMGKGILRAQIESAALKLKPGEISEIVETDKDFYLIQLVAAENETVRPFKEVREKILEKLQEPKAKNAIEQYLQDLRTRGNVRYLVSKEEILKG